MTDTSTATPTSPSPGTAATAPLAPSVAKVLAALHRLGGATAAGTAAEAGLGYSTTTPKLRTLENQGLAEPIRADDGRTLWRLTDPGHAHAQQDQADDPGPADTHPAAEPTAAEAAAAATPVTPDDEHHDVAGDTPEHLDDTPAQAELPGDTATGVEQPAAPQGPAGTDGDPADAGEPRDDTADASPSDKPGAESDTEAADATDPAAHAPQTGDGATQDTGTGGAQPATAPAAAPRAEPAAQRDCRRASGTLRGAVLDILEAHPGQRYKTSELCKLIDKANEGTGAKKASAGAVHNAAVKLVEAGRAVQAVEKPATFAFADVGSSSTA